MPRGRDTSGDPNRIVGRDRTPSVDRRRVQMDTSGQSLPPHLRRAAIKLQNDARFLGVGNQNLVARAQGLVQGALNRGESVSDQEREAEDLILDELVRQEGSIGRLMEERPLGLGQERGVVSQVGPTGESFALTRQDVLNMEEGGPRLSPGSGDRYDGTPSRWDSTVAQSARGGDDDVFKEIQKRQDKEDDE